MKVKIKKDLASAAGLFHAGDEPDVHEAQAKHWIDAGLAEKVEEAEAESPALHPAADAARHAEG